MGISPAFKHFGKQNLSNKFEIGFSTLEKGVGEIGAGIGLFSPQLNKVGLSSLTKLAKDFGEFDDWSKVPLKAKSLLPHKITASYKGKSTKGKLRAIALLIRDACIVSGISLFIMGFLAKTDFVQRTAPKFTSVLNKIGSVNLLGSKFGEFTGIKGVAPYLLTTATLIDTGSSYNDLINQKELKPKSPEIKAVINTARVFLAFFGSSLRNLSVGVFQLVKLVPISAKMLLCFEEAAEDHKKRILSL